MPVLALGRAVLLVCIGTGNMVRDPNALKKGIQLLILTTQSVCIAIFLRLNVRSTRF